jgi:SnoaL-like polyketide cyclase
MPQPLHPEGAVDRDGIEGDGKLVPTAVPDVTVTFPDAFGQGDRFVVRHIVHGTHPGPLLGLPPSGKTVTVSGTDTYRIQDGKIVEEWAQPDLFGANDRGRRPLRDPPTRRPAHRRAT